MKLSRTRIWVQLMVVLSLQHYSAAFVPHRQILQSTVHRLSLEKNNDNSQPIPQGVASSSGAMEEQVEEEDTFTRPPSDPFEATGERELMTTLGGGTALMFEMIRLSLLDWKSSKPQQREEQQQQRKEDDVFPRWRPYSGVSDSNTAFRTDAPSMNNEAFARSMWRNLRKRNKPSLWRNALRTFDRMTALEEEQLLEGAAGISNNNNIIIRRSNIHYEGAMLACAKLGLWQRALEIYHYVYQKEQDLQQQAMAPKKKQPGTKPASSMYRTQFVQKKSPPKSPQKLERLRIRRSIKVSDDMIFSLVKACVRASFQRSRKYRGQKLSVELEEQEAALRRIPLDTALEVLSTMEEAHNIPIVAHYVNPLAKAYQSLGYIQQARDILQTMLSNRTAGEEPEDGSDRVNVYDFSAKDKGSYSLLVQGSVVTGDWGAAVQALGEMTDAGLYPNKRHSNIWSEISERQTRPRAVGSWKKKRDDYWTDSVI